MKYKEFWYDIDYNQHYIFKKDKITPCNSIGNLFNRFTPYFSGISDYKDRIVSFNESGKSHFLPSIPILYKRKFSSQSIIEHAGITKIDGYVQFPRPKKNLSFVLPNKYKMSSCIEPSKIIKSNTVGKMRKNHPINTPKYKSGIKPDYFKLMKPTLTPLKSVKGFSENVINLLMNKTKESINEKSRTTKTVKSYNDINRDLIKEKANFEGYQPPIEKEERIGLKVLYDIKIPTETELYAKSRKLRMIINRKAAKEEAHNEKKDYLLLKKHREHLISNEEAIKKLFVPK